MKREIRGRQRQMIPDQIGHPRHKEGGLSISRNRRHDSGHHGGKGCRACDGVRGPSLSPSEPGDSVAGECPPRSLRRPSSGHPQGHLTWNTIATERHRTVEWCFGAVNACRKAANAVSELANMAGAARHRSACPSPRTGNIRIHTLTYWMLPISNQIPKQFRDIHIRHRYTANPIWSGLPGMRGPASIRMRKQCRSFAASAVRSVDGIPRRDGQYPDDPRSKSQGPAMLRTVPFRRRFCSLR